MSFDRLLFASIHGHLDPSSGAALTTRDLLELLSTRGVDARALTMGVLDYAEDTALSAVLGPLGVPIRRARAVLGSGL